jgi:hypothetical protein
MGRVVQQLLAEQRRFPMQIATSLSQAFAHHGLQFFKVNKTVTHVAVARPHYLDLETTPVSDGVKRIVEFINANPKSNRRKLIEALAPAPAKPPVAPVVPVEGETATPPSGATAITPAPIEATPEQTALISDLHWLVHQGHVIEFANGQLDTAKKPLPKPPKPEAKSAKPAPEAVVPPPAETAAVASAPVPVETTPDVEATATAEPALPAEPEPKTEASPSASEVPPPSAS